MLRPFTAGFGAKRRAGGWAKGALAWGELGVLQISVPFAKLPPPSPRSGVDAVDNLKGHRCWRSSEWPEIHKHWTPSAWGSTGQASGRDHFLSLFSRYFCCISSTKANSRTDKHYKALKCILVFFYTHLAAETQYWDPLLEDASIPALTFKLKLCPFQILIVWLSKSLSTTCCRMNTKLCYYIMCQGVQS